jgi:hypothetical protein
MEIAEAAGKVYNDNILEQRKYLLRNVLLGVLAGLALVFSAHTSLSAQSVLQNQSSGSLQPQSQPAQNTGNNLNQTGTLQENNSQNALNQKASQPLGVVSDPRKTSADVVVQPSNTLKTDLTKNSSSSGPSKLLITLLVLSVVVGAPWLILRRLSSQPALVEDEGQEQRIAEESVLAEPAPKPNKAKKPKKKRKKPHQL